MPAAASCAVCVNRFSAKARKRVTCPACGYDQACLSCVKRFVTETPSIQEVACLQCSVPFDPEFVRETFPAKFTRDVLEPRKAEALVREQMALAPSTVPFMELANEIREDVARVDDMRADIARMQAQMEQLGRSVNEKRQWMSLPDCDALAARMGRMDIASSSRAFVRKCTRGGCSGTVTSPEWKCSSCRVDVCSRCWEDRGDSHTCDPATVETVEMIASDTKPCPMCNTRIHKSEGCYQMFCTRCHCKFDWAKGTVIHDTRNFHNPHHAAWLDSIRLERPSMNTMSIKAMSIARRAGFEHPLTGAGLVVARLPLALDSLYAARYRVNLFVHRERDNASSHVRYRTERIMVMSGAMTEAAFGEKLVEDRAAVECAKRYSKCAEDASDALCAVLDSLFSDGVTKLSQEQVDRAVSDAREATDLFNRRSSTLVSTFGRRAFGRSGRKPSYVCTRTMDIVFR